MGQTSGKTHGGRGRRGRLPDDMLETIKARMDEPGLSKEAFAKELGISVSTLYAYIHEFCDGVRKRTHQKRKIPAETLAAIRARMDEPGIQRRALAKELGISINTLYYYIHEMGGDVRRYKSRRCGRQEVEELVRKYYPYYSATEIIAMNPNDIDVADAYINRVARDLGVIHTPETADRLQRKGGILCRHDKAEAKRRVAEALRRAKAYGKQRNARKMQKAAAQRRMTRSINKARRLSAEIQALRESRGGGSETKAAREAVQEATPVDMPAQDLRIRAYLTDKHGYLCTAEPYVLRYNVDTRRVANEALYTEKFGFWFEEAQQ